MGPKITHTKSKEASSDAPLIVTGVVYSATQSMPASDLRKAAYDFMLSGRYLETDLHYNGLPTGSQVVASNFFEQMDGYPPNSWVVSIAIYDPVLKDMVLKGDIDRFSLDPEGTEEVIFSRIEVLKGERNDSGNPIDTKGDYPMTLQQEITSLKEKCEALMKKSVAKDAGIAAQLSDLHNKIEALAGPGNVTSSLEKGEGQKDVIKGFWHGGLMVPKVPAAKGTVKSKSENRPQTKLKSCGLISNWH